MRGGREHSQVPDELPRRSSSPPSAASPGSCSSESRGETGDATKLLPEVLEIVAEPYLGEEATAAVLIAP